MSTVAADEYGSKTESLVHRHSTDTAPPQHKVRISTFGLALGKHFVRERELGCCPERPADLVKRDGLFGGGGCWDMSILTNNMAGSEPPEASTMQSHPPSPLPPTTTSPINYL